MSKKAKTLPEPNYKELFRLRSRDLSQAETRIVDLIKNRDEIAKINKSITEELNKLRSGCHGPTQFEIDLRRDNASLQSKVLEAYELSNKARGVSEDLQAADLEVRSLTKVIEGLAQVLAHSINTKVRRSCQP